VAGRANKQIAFELGISPRTVEIYRANLMTKMQAGSLSDLVRMAILAGILGPDISEAGNSHPCSLTHIKVKPAIFVLSDFWAEQKVCPEQKPCTTDPICRIHTRS
jgi:regulatory LuxR family protein